MTDVTESTETTDVTESTESGLQVTGDMLRARTWDEYIGQKALKEQLEVTIEARWRDGRPLDHMLLVGPPGYGKTTLAAIIADRLKEPYEHRKMPIRERDFVHLLRTFVGILLLDEIHAAPKSFQEQLLPVLEDGYMQTCDGRRVDTAGVTILGATTEPQRIIKPLWDRFLLKPNFAEYDEVDMRQILINMGNKVGVSFPDNLANRLAHAAAGTPRVAGSLVRAARDLIIVGRDASFETILTQAGVDEDGLTSRHMDYLRTLDELGGQSGLRNLCSMLQLSQSVVEDLERLLLKRNYIALEPNGRALMDRGDAKLRSHGDLEYRRKKR